MRAWLISLLIHLSLITGACFVLTLMLWGPQPDANIGAGMLQFTVLAGLALPWSLLWFSGVLPEQRDSVETLVFISFALFNVILHGVMALLMTRGRGSTGFSASTERAESL